MVGGKVLVRRGVVRLRSWIAKVEPRERLGGVLVLVGAVCVVGFFVGFDVCEQQVTNSGAVVSVCRYPQLTDPPIAAFGLVMVVGLGLIFAEVSWLGISLKRKVDEAVRVIGEVKKLTQDALLAEKYNGIRRRRRRSKIRDAEMYDLFGEMRNAVEGDRDFDVVDHLRNRADPGMRLAGYAYLQGRPDIRWIPELVQALRREDKGFNEEMALNALRITLRDHCSYLDDELSSELRSRAARHLAKNRQSRRAKAIGEIFAQCAEAGGRVHSEVSSTD